MRDEIDRANRRNRELESALEERRLHEGTFPPLISSLRSTFSRSGVAASLVEARNIAIAKYSDLKGRVSHLVKFKNVGPCCITRFLCPCSRTFVVVVWLALKSLSLFP